MLPIGGGFRFCQYNGGFKYIPKGINVMDSAGVFKGVESSRHIVKHGNSSKFIWHFGVHAKFIVICTDDGFALIVRDAFVENPINRERVDILRRTTLFQSGEGKIYPGVSLLDFGNECRSIRFERH